jgi:hypothetical protein
MKRRLLRLAAAFIFCAAGYGLLTVRAVYAQCGCSCTVVCPNTCNFSCDGCSVGEAIAAISKCCSEEGKNVTPYCSN